MTAELTVTAQTAVTAVRDLLLWAVPQGLQGGARRNAWRALVDDSIRAKDRAEAASAMGLALIVAARQGAGLEHASAS